MAKSGLPDSLEVGLLMADRDFTSTTAWKVLELLEAAKSLEEHNNLSARLVNLLETGISEADFLKELEK